MSQFAKYLHLSVNFWETLTGRLRGIGRDMKSLLIPSWMLRSGDWHHSISSLIWISCEANWTVLSEWQASDTKITIATNEDLRNGDVSTKFAFNFFMCCIMCCRSRCVNVWWCNDGPIRSCLETPVICSEHYSMPVSDSALY